MYNKVRASDDFSGIANQIYRNLSFKSEIIEFGPVLEIDFFHFIQAKIIQMNLTLAPIF